MSSLRFLCGALLSSALVLACTDTSDASTTADVTAGSADGAQPTGGSDRPPPPKGKPPQEAIDACAKAAAGDACAFDLDSHHVTGTCRQGPDGQGPLACAPDHPPPRKPPQEAFDACDGLVSDDACAVTLPDGTSIDGSCRTTPDGALVCAPAGEPPPPPAH